MQWKCVKGAAKPAFPDEIKSAELLRADVFVVRADAQHMPWRGLHRCDADLMIERR